MALSTGLVHGGNQNQKHYAIDDTIPDKKRAARPISTAAPKKGNPPNDLYYIEDKINPTDGYKASAEATTLTAKRSETRKDLGCRLHHIEEKVTVGMVANKNSTYGRDGMTEYEAQRKDVLEAQLDSWEWIMGGNQNCQAGNGTGTAYVTRGFGKWISPSSESLAGDSPTDIADSDFRTPAGSILTLHNEGLDLDKVTNRMTKEHVENVLGSLWSVLGQPREFDVPCTLAFKRMINSFLQVDKVVDGLTSIARFNGDIDKRRLGFVVEIYATETGTLTFKLSTFLPAIDGATPGTEAFFLDYDHAHVAVRNVPGFYAIGKTELTEATAVAGTQGLACRPRMMGKVVRNAAS